MQEKSLLYDVRGLCSLVLLGQVHLTQHGRLHQIHDAVGELVLDAAACASEPRSDLPFLHKGLLYEPMTSYNSLFCHFSGDSYTK